MKRHGPEIGQKLFFSTKNGLILEQNEQTIFFKLSKLATNTTSNSEICFLKNFRAVHSQITL